MLLKYPQKCQGSVWVSRMFCLIQLSMEWFYFKSSDKHAWNLRLHLPVCGPKHDTYSVSLRSNAFRSAKQKKICKAHNQTIFQELWQRSKHFAAHLPSVTCWLAIAEELPFLSAIRRMFHIRRQMSSPRYLSQRLTFGEQAFLKVRNPRWCRIGGKRV